MLRDWKQKIALWWKLHRWWCDAGPWNRKEMEDGREQIVQMDVGEGSAWIREPQVRMPPLSPQNVQCMIRSTTGTTAQIEIFNVTAKPSIVQSVL
jgi:hypothetical protein